MSTDTPTQTKLGYDDYVCFPEDGNRHEIIDGQHYMNPAPTWYHQKLSSRIQHQLYTQIELSGLGDVAYAPLDVQLADHDIVQPDLVVILKREANIITPTKVKGSPDLLIEILSPSSVTHDRVRKKKCYLQAGVPEYWIVDPENQLVEQFVLRDGQYTEKLHDNVVTLTITDNVSVDFSKVW